MKRICLNCGDFKKHHVKGLCNRCYKKKRRLENPEQARIADKKYRLRYKEKRKVLHEKWVKENPEKKKAIDRKYYQNNPGKVREKKLKRRGYGKVKKGTIDKVINSNILKYGRITCENINGKKEDGHCEHCENGFHIDHRIKRL